MTSRRGAARWALPETTTEPEVDVLIPTAGRASELAVTLSGLAAQDDPPFDVVISDQSQERPVETVPAVQAMIRVLRAQGRSVRVLRHLPRRGMAEQRQYLLDAARARRVLFLDDDIWLEPHALPRLDAALSATGAGFVGFAPQGLSFLDDDRPDERRRLELWGPAGVSPERVRRGTTAFTRWPLHNAANLAHAAAELELDDHDVRPYRIAWVGACVLFDRQELVHAGGFDFWRDLPPEHAGEDVAAEWRVMERRGGAGVLPSGAVHLEAPTTITRRPTDASDVVFGTAAQTPDPDGTRQERRDDDERRIRPHSGAEVSGRHRLPGRAG